MHSSFIFDFIFNVRIKAFVTEFEFGMFCVVKKQQRSIECTTSIRLDAHFFEPVFEHSIFKPGLRG